MTTLVIYFPKIGVQTSTWVDDEWWSSLSPSKQEAVMSRFVKNAYPTELIHSKTMRYRPGREDYTWSEL